MNCLEQYKTYLLTNKHIKHTTIQHLHKTREKQPTDIKGRITKLSRPWFMKTLVLVKYRF